MRILLTFGRGKNLMLKSFLLPLCFLLIGRPDAQAQAVPCPTNIDFSLGLFTNWDCYTGTCCPINTPTVTAPTANRHTITTGFGTDQYGGFPIVAPGGGLFSLKVGNNGTGAEAERVRYHIRVPLGFNNYSFAFKYAVVFEDPNHGQADQPRFEVKAFDSTTPWASIPCATHTYVAGALPGFLTSNQGFNVRYLPWTNGTLNLSGMGGKTIIVEVSSGDCALGGHFGYGYFDVISCGQFAAAVATCNLDSNFITLSAPGGYQAYQWTDSAGTTTLGTGQTITVPAPAVAAEWKVILTPYNSLGCPDTVKTPRITNFNIQASPDKVCNTVGVPVQLNVAVNGGGGPLTYNWTNGSSLPTPPCLTPLPLPPSPETTW